MNNRIVVFRDYGDRAYIETDAPSEEIEDAIAYKDELLDSDVEIDSEFDVVQKYLQERGYYFEEVVEDVEEYWW